jgi:ribosomal protein L16 Arg81 hydroxylase
MVTPDWLLSPIPKCRFFSDYWERSSLFIKRNCPDYYRDVLSLSEVDNVICSANIQLTNIRMVQGSVHVPAEDFVASDGLIDPIEVLKFFERGNTIILEHMHKQQNGLRKLCEGLTQELGITFQTNLYMTPPLCQGFDLHYDTHDVFILQIHGRKRWFLQEPSFRLPLPGQIYAHNKCNDRAKGEQIIIEPGDLIYIPRGYLHSATSIDETSLHITLGVISRTWTDVIIEAVALACAKDPAFREGLPIELLGKDKEEAKERARFLFDELWDKLSNAIDVKEVIENFSTELTSRQRSLVSGQLQQIVRLPDLNEDSVVKARRGPIKWSDEGDTLSIVAFEKIITFPSRLKMELSALLSGDVLRVADVSTNINSEGKVTLAKRLVREGLLEVLDS